jgi:hypothetical protein
MSMAEPTAAPGHLVRSEPTKRPTPTAVSTAGNLGFSAPEDVSDAHR